MIPPSFEYLRPNTIPEAIAMLQQHGVNQRVTAQDFNGFRPAVSPKTDNAHRRFHVRKNQF